jgi:hypothetical protein
MIFLIIVIDVKFTKAYGIGITYTGLLEINLPI